MQKPQEGNMAEQLQKSQSSNITPMVNEKDDEDDGQSGMIF